jgi:hypothetical protein
MKNTKFTIGNESANAITLNVIVKQKSISKKDGVELESNFKANFEVFVHKYVSVGQSLARILKALNFQIVQGKKSGKLKGLNLRTPFDFVVMNGDVIVFKSKETQFDAKGGLTEKSQNRFFKGFAKQFYEKYNNVTLAYMNEDATFTSEDDDNLFRSVMDTKIVDALETMESM